MERVAGRFGNGPRRWREGRTAWVRGRTELFPHSTILPVGSLGRTRSWYETGSAPRTKCVAPKEGRGVLRVGDRRIPGRGRLLTPEAQHVRRHQVTTGTPGHGPTGRRPRPQPSLEFVVPLILRRATPPVVSTVGDGRGGETRGPSATIRPWAVVVLVHESERTCVSDSRRGCRVYRPPPTPVPRRETDLPLRLSGQSEIPVPPRTCLPVSSRDPGVFPFGKVLRGPSTPTHLPPPPQG